MYVDPDARVKISKKNDARASENPNFKKHDIASDFLNLQTIQIVKFTTITMQQYYTFWTLN